MSETLKERLKLESQPLSALGKPQGYYEGVYTKVMQISRKKRKGKKKSRGSGDEPEEGGGQLPTVGEDDLVVVEVESDVEPSEGDEVEEEGEVEEEVEVRVVDNFAEIPEPNAGPGFDSPPPRSHLVGSEAESVASGPAEGRAVPGAASAAPSGASSHYPPLPNSPSTSRTATNTEEGVRRFEGGRSVDDSLAALQLYEDEDEDDPPAARYKRPPRSRR